MIHSPEEPTVTLHDPDNLPPEDRAGDSLLALEDKLAGLEAYISHTKQPSKRIMRALLKRARFHARVARSIHFLGGGT